MRTSIVIFVFFLLFLARVWTPVVDYFYLPDSPELAESQIDTMKTSPEDAVLRSLYAIDSWVVELEGSVLPTSEAFVPSRNMLRKQGLIPFSTSSLQSGNSSRQLAINGLSVVNYLLDHYEETQEDWLLRESLDYALAFYDWEKGVFIDETFLSNDHAVASRMIVVIRLWNHFRSSGIYEQGVAQELLSYGWRLANWLSKSVFYTYKTNHGTMQNLALIAAGIAFPDFEESDAWIETGMDRLEEQIEYLVSEEGFFLEHSFEYHAFFLTFLEAVQHYADVDNRARSESVEAALRKGQALLEDVTRPDGTLPSYGDTSNKRYTAKTRQLPFVSYYPQSSFIHTAQPSALCERGSYLSMFWGNYANHGHKHQDDGAIDLWHCGQAWIRGAGYVPYWHSKRSAAEGWHGANAPHFHNEGEAIPGNAMLTHIASNDKVIYLAFQRQGAKGEIFREVVKSGDWMLVLDRAHDSQEDLVVSWALHPDVGVVGLDDATVLKLGNNAGKPSNPTMHFFAADPDTEVQLVNGGDLGNQDIRGWAEVDGVLRSTTTVMHRSGPGKGGETWQAMFVSFGDPGQECLSESVGATLKASRERFAFSNCSGLKIDLDRNGAKAVSVFGVDRKEYLLEPVAVDDGYLDEWKRIDTRTLEIFEQYGDRFKSVIPYRTKVSLAALVLFVLNLLALWLIYRFQGLKYVRVPIKIVSVAGWCAVLAWLHFVYLG